MSRALVVYFSRTGHTRKIALELAESLGADVERIEEPRGRSGFFGYWRSGREGYRKLTTVIHPIQKRPSDYDLVLIGTPIWAGNVSSPVRTYIAGNAGSFRRVAFFCTHGGSSAAKVMTELSELCGVRPLATLAVKEREIRAGSYRGGLKEFAKQVRRESGAG